MKCSLGVYLCVFLAAAHALVTQGLRTTSSRILFFFITTSFLLEVSACGVFTAEATNLLRYSLTKNPDLPLEDKFNAANDAIMVLGVWDVWLMAQHGFVFFIGDIVVVWRAWVLCPRGLLQRVIPVFLLFATIVLSLATSIIGTVTGQFEAPGGFFSGVVAVLTITVMACSLATNVAATAFIGIQAYQHRKFMKQTIGIRQSKAATVLLYLTESGTVYCVIQIIVLVLQFVDRDVYSPTGYSTEFCFLFQEFVSTVYAPLITVIVSYNRSMADTTVNMDTGTFEMGRYGRNARNRASAEVNAGTHISFAPARRRDDSFLESDSAGAVGSAVHIDEGRVGEIEKSG
jgi:hypothetical protein